MNNSPRFFIAWRHNEENHWEAVPENKFAGFAEKLLNEGVNPASIFFSMGVMVKWLFPSYHEDERSLWINEIYDKINGAGNPSDYKAPDVPITKRKSDSLYGYISPDGRYFHCEYGGHYTLAETIVGSLQKINDARMFLEEQGWLVIHHDPFNCGKYAVGMGEDKKITDEQLKTIERIGLPTNSKNLSDYL